MFLHNLSRPEDSSEGKEKKLTYKEGEKKKKKQEASSSALRGKVSFSGGERGEKSSLFHLRKGEGKNTNLGEALTLPLGGKEGGASDVTAGRKGGKEKKKKKK